MDKFEMDKRPQRFYDQMKWIDKLCKKVDWTKSKVKLVHKDMDWVSIGTSNISIDDENGKECNYISISSYDSIYYPPQKDVISTKEFKDKFLGLCKKVIDKDFEFINDDNEWYINVLEEQYGSGVQSLLWLLYNIELYKDTDNLKAIIIDGYDSTLFPLSMKQLNKLFRYYTEVNTIFTVYNYPISDTLSTPIDDMFITHSDGIKSLRECTDRELKESNNIPNLLLAGEFNEK